MIGVHFLDYEQFSEYPDFRFCFELRDVRYLDLRLTTHLTAYMFELPKFEKLSKPEQWGEKLFEWLHFFNHAQEEGEHAMRTQYTNVLETLYQRGYQNELVDRTLDKILGGFTLLFLSRGQALIDREIL